MRARSSSFRESRTEGSRPFEINRLERDTYVLNGEGSMRVGLLTVAENTFKSTIIPEHTTFECMHSKKFALKRARYKIWYNNKNELIRNTNS